MARRTVKGGIRDCSLAVLAVSPPEEETACSGKTFTEAEAPSEPAATVLSEKQQSVPPTREGSEPWGGLKT